MEGVKRLLDSCGPERSHELLCQQMFAGCVQTSELSHVVALLQPLCGSKTVYTSLYFSPTSSKRLTFKF